MVGSLSMSRLVTELETSVFVVSISGAVVVTSTLSVDPATRSLNPRSLWSPRFSVSLCFAGGEALGFNFYAYVPGGKLGMT